MAQPEIPTREMLLSQLNLAADGILDVHQYGHESQGDAPVHYEFTAPGKMPEGSVTCEGLLFNWGRGLRYDGRLSAGQAELKYQQMINSRGEE